MSFIFLRDYLRLSGPNVCPIFWPMTCLLHPTQISRPKKSDLQQPHPIPSLTHLLPIPKDTISDTNLCWLFLLHSILCFLIFLLRQFTSPVLTPIVQDVNGPFGHFFSPCERSQSHLPCRIYVRPFLLYRPILWISWVQPCFLGIQSLVWLKLTL